MRAWQLKVVGWVCAAAMPLVMAALVTSDLALVFALAFFIGLPLMRPVLGEDRTSGLDFPVWNEWFTGFLGALPALTLASLVVALPLVAWHVAVATPLQWAAALTAYFVACALATTAAHELLHRREAWRRWCARLIAAVMGYPHLTDEHLLHHASGDFREQGAFAAERETVYHYAARQGLGNLAHCWTLQTARTRHGRVNPLALGWAVTTATATLFYSIAGASGLLFYVAGAALTWFSVQTINYVQHYGLRSVSPGAAHDRDLACAWDDGCLLQACLTFNMTYHEQHHAEPSRPYWLLENAPTAARLPASYSVMFLLAMYPRAFFSTMAPLLERLRAHDSGPAGTPSRARRFCLPSSSTYSISIL